MRQNVPSYHPHFISVGKRNPNRSFTVADPRGALGTAPLGPISFIFMQLLANILPSNRLVPVFWGWRPPLENPGSATGSVVSQSVQPPHTISPGRCCWVRSLARVHIHPLLALFALDVAAPVELALALGDAQDRGGVVASAAADNVATVRAERRLVAFPARCPERACK